MAWAALPLTGNGHQGGPIRKEKNYLPWLRWYLSSWFNDLLCHRVNICLSCKNRSTTCMGEGGAAPRPTHHASKRYQLRHIFIPLKICRSLWYCKDFEVEFGARDIEHLLSNAWRGCQSRGLGCAHHRATTWNWCHLNLKSLVFTSIKFIYTDKFHF